MGPRRLRLAALEIAVTVAILVPYFWLRGVRPDDTESSVRRSLALIRFEQQTGLFREVQWQGWFINNDFAMAVANWIYAWGPYPVLLMTAVWLVLFKDPVRFRFVRNVMFVSGAVGIVSYWLIPAAPPRLMELNGYDFGFIDTVRGPTSDVVYFQPGPFVNDYAALPSFHFGWVLLSSMAVWVNTTNRWARVGAVAMSVAMWWSVTVTGNHYFFDMILGGVVVVLSWILVQSLGDVRFRDLWARFRNSRQDGHRSGHRAARGR